MKHRLSTASFKDFSSSKDNFIDTRTKIIVGVIPWPGKNFSKTKEVEMNRSYNHIKHFADDKEVLKSKIHRPDDFVWIHDEKHHTTQLDEKQHHTGFDYYEYDMP